jgi:hypothetical protein
MKTTALFAFLLALCNLTMFAQAEKKTRTVHVTEKSSIHQPPQEVPASLKIIYTNLNSVSTDLYNDLSGWSVSGPNSFSGSASSLALPFTPKADSHVSMARIAMQYSAGANQVNLSIYADSNGVPGSLLAGPVTVKNLPELGTCCLLADASFAAVAVSGGTQYWIVADTPPSGTGSDFEGLWDTVAVPVIPLAFNFDGFGWQQTNGNQLPAGAVFGSIP